MVLLPLLAVLPAGMRSAFAAGYCSNSSSSFGRVGAALLNATRSIIVPQQLKAYGGTFSRSIGERADHLVGNVLLQSLSPSRTAKSPLLATNVKTKTVTNFEDMLLAPELREALAQSLHITTPSPIQQTAIEVILQRKDTVVAAPHGEGKTLAYLLPLYQNMMKDRDVYKIPLRERRPRMILLAPTKELIAQLQHVCATLDAATGLRSVSFSSRKRAKHHLSLLMKNTLADVVIMDPKVVLRLIRSRRLFLDDIRYVAVDEADAMLSSQHDHDAVHLLMKVQKRMMFKYLWPVQTQTVFATAYITRKLEFVVGKKFPQAVTCLQRQRMHRPPDTLSHRFFAIHRTQEKMDVLQHVLKKHDNQPRVISTDVDEVQAHTQPHYLTGTLEEFMEQLRHAPPPPRQPQPQARQCDSSPVSAEDVLRQEEEFHPRPGGAHDGATTSFCTSSTSALSLDVKRDGHEEVRRILERVRPLRWEHLTTVAAPFTCHIPRTVFGEGQRVIVFTSGVDSATAVYHQLRGRGFACSLLHAALPWDVRRRMFADFASGRTNILCATDLAARGLDVHVDVVVNFDMPTNALVYLSRAGRTARQGRLGKVYSLYTKHQGVIVAAVRAFLRKNLPLEGLSNWKSHMMTPRYAEWRTHKMNAIARSYVSLITQKTIPAHLERTYLHHNATWRPLFHPQTTGIHGGVPPRQQQRVMDAVMDHAVWFRRAQLARRKGGRAKFGRRDAARGVWNNIGGIATNSVANAAQSSNPGGPDFGPPQGPPK
ncbi:DEAD/DEAH box helicase-like protein [Trypanosoma rangeli]|uniref:DEAD/DEAH box helicase-like protein n=1 Tax=Trypanosoma rangeli TaxID=5698 RepID=A0A422N2G7_TRYRA|nr:DEAD/DEAH box helicase-like protein [Trypanosoma rangeli]RNE99657.1 DEAD/DEAH box helicase-like protein [Trypanosoma rangeli]|eukprot:RNE99657.1 DEAD/DEAH box helicase-like protein [Trypanosoma rangeli]